MIDGALDIAIIVVMAYFILRGALRGLVKEVVAIVGLFVAFWLAGVYGPIGAEHLVTFDENKATREVISFLVIFLVVYFIIGLISIFADKIVKITLSPMGSALMGAVVGGLKGALMCAVILMGAEAFLKPDNPLFKNSALWGPIGKPLVAQVRSFTPEEIRKSLAGATSGISGTLSNLMPQTGQNQAAAERPPMAAPLTVIDWKSIQTLMATNPEAINPAWRDKLRNVDPSVGLTPEELQRFAADHKNLFNLRPEQTPGGGASVVPAPPAAPAPSTPEVPRPNWPQPSGE